MSSTLHTTFLYHCAFAHSDNQPHVDVLLSPSTMEMEHVASLRVPEACVVDDGEHPGQEQESETADRRRTTDVIWRLEGYDLWIDPPADDAALHPPAVDVKLSFKEQGKEWVVADFNRLSHVGIDRRFLEDEAPEALHKGARVRIWDGKLRAVKPDGDLRNRLWLLEDGGEPVGLADRVDYKKDLGDRGTVTLRFRKFGDVRFKTVTLRPAANGGRYGVLRLHITNDPTVQEIHDPAQASCADLPHFKSYSLIVAQNAEGRRTLKKPSMIGGPAARMALTIPEAGDLCCPCGGGQPEP